MFGRSYWQIAYLSLLIILPFACFAVALTVLDEQWGFDHPGSTRSYLVIAAIVQFLSIGLLLHIFRENWRLVFGALEVILSAVFFRTAMVNSENILRVMTANGLPFTAALITVLALLTAALYVFLGGLDNIGRGVTGHPRLEKAWRWLSLRAIVRRQ
jgi:hypothetical protein